MNAFEVARRGELRAAQARDQHDWNKIVEREIFTMLGRWVSELEPVIIYQFGMLVGLGQDGQVSYSDVTVEAWV